MKAATYMKDHTPSLSERPTEWASAAIGATWAVITLVVDVPPDVVTAVTTWLLVVVVPAVTWVAARRRR